VLEPDPRESHGLPAGVAGHPFADDEPIASSDFSMRLTVGAETPSKYWILDCDAPHRSCSATMRSMSNRAGVNAVPRNSARVTATTRSAPA